MTRLIVCYLTMLLASIACAEAFCKNVSLIDEPAQIIELIKKAEFDGTRKDSAFQYIETALELSKKSNFKQGLAFCYRSLIAFAKTETEIDSLMKLSLQYFDLIKNRKERSLVYLRAASRSLSLGHNYINAYEYANQFLAQSNSDSEPEFVARGWNIIGEVFRISKDFKKASEAYSRAKKFAIDHDSIKYLAPFINSGTIWLERGLLDSAMYQYNFIQEYMIKNRLTYTSGFAYIHYRKSLVNLKKGLLTDALREADEAFRLYNNLEHIEGKILALGAKTEILFAKKDYQGTVALGKKTIDLAVSANYLINNVEKVAGVVSDSYLKLNDYKNGFYYLNLQKKINDDLYSTAIVTGMVKQVFSVQDKKLKLEHQLAEEERTKNSAIIILQRTIIFSSVAGLILLVVGCILLYRQTKTKSILNMELQRKQDEISLQNEELQAQAEELTSQSEELMAINEKMDSVNKNLEQIVSERTRVIKNQNERLREYAFFNAHRVRGPLARILGLISVIDMEFPEFHELTPYKEMLKRASNDLDVEIRKVNDLLENSS